VSRSAHCKHFAQARASQTLSSQSYCVGRAPNCKRLVAARVAPCRQFRMIALVRSAIPCPKSDNASCGAAPRLPERCEPSRAHVALVNSADPRGHLNNVAAGGLCHPVQIATGNKMIASNTRWIERHFPSLESFRVLALLSVLIAVPTFLMIHVLEPGLVLPAVSILLFAEAAIVAIVARSIHVHKNSEQVTLWDITGAFTMMGCAAAIFSEPDQAAPLFEQLVERHPDTPR
jgi:hypothetical protein